MPVSCSLASTCVTRYGYPCTHTHTLLMEGKSGTVPRSPSAFDTQAMVGSLILPLLDLRLHLHLCSSSCLLPFASPHWHPPKEAEQKRGSHLSALFDIFSKIAANKVIPKKIKKKKGQSYFERLEIPSLVKTSWTSCNKNKM